MVMATGPVKFRYKDMIDLGFVQKQQYDNVFLDQHGYEWFLVEMKLAKGIYLTWDSETREVELVRWKPKTGDILGRMPMFSIEEIKEVIEFYKKK
jgi:hypothetical protein